MLGYLGYYGVTSSVAVPNIVGKSTSQASADLAAVGLVLGSSTGSTTSGATSGNNGYIATQSQAEGTLVAPGTVITYTTYNYVPPCSPSWSCGGCNGCTQFCSDGCGNSYTADCSSVVYVATVSEYLTGQNSQHLEAAQPAPA